MACFLAPMVLAIIFSVIQKVSRSAAERLKLWILNTLLWGGAVLLALEHAWHGELVPWPPFLTAMTNPIDMPVMFYEIATIGTAMTAVTVAVWGIILTLSYFMPKIVAAKVASILGKMHTITKT
ncbi:MAG: hypothetical protein QXT26_05390 [Thermoproteota archaeon]